MEHAITPKTHAPALAAFPTDRSNVALVKAVPGLCMCVLFWLLGEAIVRALGFSYGGGLVGFLACTIALRVGVIPIARVDNGASLLVTHLAFPLVGVTASVVFEARALAADGATLIVASAIAALLVLVFVGLASSRVMRGLKKDAT